MSIIYLTQIASTWCKMMQFEVLYSAGRLLETFGERRHSNARFNVAFAHHRCHRAQPVSIARTHQARCTTAPLSTNRRSCQSPIDRLCVKKSMPDRERERELRIPSVLLPSLSVRRNSIHRGRGGRRRRQRDGRTP